MDTDENQFLLQLEVSNTRRLSGELTYSSGCKYPIKLELDINITVPENTTPRVLTPMATTPIYSAPTIRLIIPNFGALSTDNQGHIESSTKIGRTIVVDRDVSEEGNLKDTFQTL